MSNHVSKVHIKITTYTNYMKMLIGHRIPQFYIKCNEICA